MKRSLIISVVTGFFLLFSQVCTAIVVIDPDAFPAGTVLNNAFPGVTLTAIGDPGVLANSNVLSLTDSFATTGSRVFGDTSSSPQYWGDGSFSYLRADFVGAATQVWLDFAANDTGDNNPYLRAYNSADILLDSDSVGFVPLGQPVTLSVADPNIAYVIASWDDINRLDNGVLDNLRFETTHAVPEPSTMLLLGSGLIGLAGYGRKKFFKK